VVGTRSGEIKQFIERDTLTKKQGRGSPDRISCYLLARLALDRALHRQGLGSQLLASALTRAAIAAPDVGGRYVIVDAIDDAAVSFYVHHGFAPIAGRPDRLVLPTKALDPYLQAAE
jgi:GNAT superfamily N-acetyltransferase